jgi:predicted RNA polymerase sigma factor
MGLATTDGVDGAGGPLVLAEYHGFSLAEVGAAMGVPEATAKTRVFRARERMRAALGETWGEWNERNERSEQEEA